VRGRGAGGNDDKSDDNLRLESQRDTLRLELRVKWE
jgi:hypothetical protein